jgi:hypothetical protein
VVGAAMLRSRLALSMVLALLGLTPVALTVPRAAPAAPVPVHLFPKAESDFLPLRDGATWMWQERRELELLNLVREGDYTESIVSLSGKEGVKVASIATTFNGAPDGRDYKLQVCGGEVSLVEVSGCPYLRPVCLFKPGCRAGDAWATDTYRDYAPGRSHSGLGWRERFETWLVTVGEYEEVEVPAGKFSALRVESVTQPRLRSVRETRWYARGVGVVKAESSPGPGSGCVIPFRESRLLKSFTPGRE